MAYGDLALPEEALSSAAMCEGMFDLLIICRLARNDGLAEEILEREVIRRIPIDAKIRITQRIVEEEHPYREAQQLADDLRKLFEFRNKIAHSVTGFGPDLDDRTHRRVLRRGEWVPLPLSQKEVEEMVTLAGHTRGQLATVVGTQTARMREL